MITEDRYRRVQHGKRIRYEKVGERYYDLDTLPVGAHLIVVHGGGGRSYCMQIDPDKVAVLAAIGLLRQAMYEAMRDANRYKAEPTGKPLTKKQRAALDEYLRLRGETMTVFKGISYHAIVDAGLKVLEDRL